MTAPAVSGPTSDRTTFRLVLGLAAGITVLRLAALAIGDLPLYLDEAQYWFWAQTPAFGYFSKPPLIAWAIGATTAVCGDGAACVKAASPLAYGVATVFAYLLGRNLFGARAGVLAALGFATLPGVTFSGLIISTDSPLLLFWTAALWAFERGLATGGRRYWLWLGLFLGLGLLAKYAMIYFAAPAMVVAALQPKGRRPWGGLLLAGAVGVLILSPNLIWNALSGFETFRHTAANASVGAKIGNIGGVVSFLGDQVAILGPAAALALLAVFWQPRRLFADPGRRMLAWFSLPVLALLIVQAFLSRAHGNWAAVAFPALIVLIMGAVDGFGMRRLGQAVLAIDGAILAVMLVGVAWGGVPFMTLAAKTDPFRWVRGWDRLAAAVEAKRAGDTPRAVIVTDRGATAELIYHLRDSDALVRRWSEDQDNPADQFAMVLDLDDAKGCDTVVVSRAATLPPALAARFSALEGPEKVEMRPYPDPKGTYYLFVGRNFGNGAPAARGCRSITRTGRKL